MTAPGKTIKVFRSAVTDIRLDGPFGTLIVEGVDQNAAGETLQSHRLSYPPEPLPAEIAAAVAAVRDFAQKAIDEA